MADYWNTSFPPFPSNVPTAALTTLNLRKLLARDQEECQALFEACQIWGFFLLDMRGCEEGKELLKLVERAFKVTERLFDLETAEKMKDAINMDKAFGYKGVGVSKVDAKGTPDRCEFYGASKDIFLGPILNNVPTVLAKERVLIATLIKQSHSICLVILSCLEMFLNLRPGILSLHDIDSTGSDQLRMIKMAPQPEGDRRTSLLAHTDFGSVTLLWNILGGLQVQRPDAEGSLGWEYVKPEAGCAVVNMGDAIVALTNGVIRSSLHRVTYAPGEQSTYDRYSMAYFCRPNDDVRMRSLLDLQEDVQKDDPTMKEWVATRTALYRKGMQVRGSGGKQMAAQHADVPS